MTFYCEATKILIFHTIYHLTFGGAVIIGKDYVLKDKRSIFIDSKAKIGKNVIIYENNRIDGETVIEDNVTIFPNCYIVDSVIEKGAKIYSSVVLNSKIGKCSSIAPFCNIKKSIIDSRVKIGSFCEIKNGHIESGKVIVSGSNFQIK